MTPAHLILILSFKIILSIAVFVDFMTDANDIQSEGNSNFLFGLNIANLMLSVLSIASYIESLLRQSGNSFWLVVACSLLTATSVIYGIFTFNKYNKMFKFFIIADIILSVIFCYQYTNMFPNLK
jgi:hypothetical protein